MIWDLPMNLYPKYAYRSLKPSKPRIMFQVGQSSCRYFVSCIMILFSRVLSESFNLLQNSPSRLWSSTLFHSRAWPAGPDRFESPCPPSTVIMNKQSLFKEYIQLLVNCIYDSPRDQRSAEVHLGTIVQTKKTTSLSTRSPIPSKPTSQYLESLSPPYTDFDGPPPTPHSSSPWPTFWICTAAALNGKEIVLTHAPSTAPLAKSHSVGEGTNQPTNQQSIKQPTDNQANKQAINSSRLSTNQPISNQSKRPTNKQTISLSLSHQSLSHYHNNLSLTITPISLSLSLQSEAGYKLPAGEEDWGRRRFMGSRKNKNRPLPMQLRRATALLVRSAIKEDEKPVKDSRRPSWWQASKKLVKRVL